MGTYSWSGKKIGGEIGEFNGKREGERQYEDKGFFSKLVTNKENFIKKHSEEGREKGEKYGEIIGKAVGIGACDIEEGIEAVVDTVESIKNDN